MIEFANFMHSLGSNLMEYLVVPLMLWTAIALPLTMLFRKLESIPPFYQYHGSTALLLGLPLSIGGTIVADFIASASQAAGTTALFVIQSPITVSASSTASSKSMINISDPMLWLGLLGAILLVGSLLMLIEIVFDYILIKRMETGLHFRPLSQYGDLVSTLPRLDHLADQTLVAYSSQIAVPFTYGWRKTKIVIPKELKEDKNSLAMAVRHELIHIKHRDYLLNGVFLSVKALFWFHPLVHHLYKWGREYREIICDNEVLANSHFSRKQYAALLVTLAQKDQPHNLAMSMAVHSSSLKKRIKIMSSRKTKPTTFRSSFIASLTSLMLIVFTISCTEMADNKPSETEAQRAKINQANSNKDDNYYKAVEKMPELVGGLSSLQSQIRYPENARKAGVEGRVIVQFIVNKEGKVENPQIMRGVGSGLDEEALRVVRQAEFTPGMQNGEPVRVQYSLPITYRLDSEKKG